MSPSPSRASVDKENKDIDNKNKLNKNTNNKDNEQAHFLASREASLDIYRFPMVGVGT